MDPVGAAGQSQQPKAVFRLSSATVKDLQSAFGNRFDGHSIDPIDRRRDPNEQPGPLSPVDVTALANLPSVKTMGFGYFVNSAIVDESDFNVRIGPDGFKQFAVELGNAGRTAKTEAGANAARSAFQALSAGMMIARDSSDQPLIPSSVAQEASRLFSAALNPPAPEPVPNRRAEATAQVVPWQADASTEWYPAMDAAAAYARSRGFADLRSQGTGANAKSVTFVAAQSRPPVNSTEYRRIYLVDKAGNEIDLGEILPEAAHLSSLKSQGALIAELKALIDAHLGS